MNFYHVPRLLGFPPDAPWAPLDRIALLTRMSGHDLTLLLNRATLAIILLRFLAWRFSSGNMQIVRKGRIWQIILMLIVFNLRPGLTILHCTLSKDHKNLIS